MLIWIILNIFRFVGFKSPSGSFTSVKTHHTRAFFIFPVKELKVIDIGLTLPLHWNIYILSAGSWPFNVQILMKTCRLKIFHIVKLVLLKISYWSSVTSFLVRGIWKDDDKVAAPCTVLPDVNNLNTLNPSLCEARLLQWLHSSVYVRRYIWEGDHNPGNGNNNWLFYCSSG